MMRAVYQCKRNAFLTLSLDEIVPLMDWFDDIEDTPICVQVRRSPPESLQFMKGQLILTDPIQIKGMREYIKRRHDEKDPLIRELSFEGNEAELEGVSYILPRWPVKPQEKPETPLKAHKVDHVEEWDRVMEKRLSGY